MHSSQPRIDRLTRLYRKHKLLVGQTVSINTNSEEAATAHLLIEDSRTENIERTDQTTEPQSLERWIRSGGAGFGDPITNREVERAAIELVTNLYTVSDWNVLSVEADKCGYDLCCRKGTVEEHVEVKGIQGEIPSFIITMGEIRQAESNLSFVICIVTLALSKKPKVRQYTGAEFINNFDLTPLTYRASLRKNSL